MVVRTINNRALIFLLMVLIRINIFIVAIIRFRTPSRAKKHLVSLLKKRDTSFGPIRMTRAYFSRGKIYQTINLPGWPSRSFNSFLQDEVNASMGHSRVHHTSFLEITAKCRLRCEHCSFAGSKKTRKKNNAGKPSDSVSILRGYGYGHIQFTGGEPLEEFEELVDCIRAAGNMDTWLLSSGYELGRVKASVLAKEGLTGIVISLDHWNEKKHNDFRGNDNAFLQAKEAIADSLRCGLLVGVSLCATREFTTEENLRKYLELASLLGVHFIRILEAKESGEYAGKDVLLSSEQKGLLEKFFYKTNLPAGDRSLPVIGYPDYMNKGECAGKGNRYIYVDMEGGVHPCAFSLNGHKNLFNHSEAEILEDLEKTECINCNLADTKTRTKIV